MLRLHVVQAKHGDCLILEYHSSSDSKHILIDGGPDTIYEEYLRQVLMDLRAGGKKLDLAIVSHVDDDHITGMLDLFKELKQQRDQGRQGIIDVGAFWHNTFSQTLGKDVEGSFRTVLQRSGPAGRREGASFRTERSIGQGDELTRLARDLEIPINPQFVPQLLLCSDDAPATIKYGRLNLCLVGPTRQNLEKMRKKWIAWLKQQEKRRMAADRGAASETAAMIDESIPNLSSIMVLCESGGKSILLTGDGRWDDLLRGLDQARRLDAQGKMHVTVLKLPHHGSRRNVTRKFFKTITADKYVICADGKYDNPDFATLQWLVETAREDRRSIEIFVTNTTASTSQVLKNYPSDKYGYRIIEMKREARTQIIEV